MECKNIIHKKLLTNTIESVLFPDRFLQYNILFFNNMGIYLFFFLYKNVNFCNAISGFFHIFVKNKVLFLEQK